MDNPNLRHWAALFSTDPSYTKGFQRAGGFKGTAVSPIWNIQRLTAHFGPQGIGWGTEAPEYHTIGDIGSGEVVVFCVLKCWYKDTPDSPPAYIWGVGGDRVVQKRQGGLFVSDEAYKSAFTDALGNAFVRLGMSADVHLDKFSDSKYVADLRDHYRGTNPAPNPLITHQKPT